MKHHIPNPTQKVVITVNKNETLARIYENDKVVAKGVALCSPEDTFDFKVGSELALHRALEAMKPKQEWVVVNREPCVGDYIRLKKEWYSFNKVGDILRVCEVLHNCVGVAAKDHPSRVGLGIFKIWHYAPILFEVVEPANATPPKPIFRKITRLPKAGDYVRVLSGYSFDTPDRYLKIERVNYTYGNVSLVTVNSDDHPGALAEGERCGVGWNYTPNAWGDEVEFYECLDD